MFDQLALEKSWLVVMSEDLSLSPSPPFHFTCTQHTVMAWARYNLAEAYLLD